MTRIQRFAGATERLRSIQLWATASVLALAPLFFGSVDQFWVSVWIVVLSITTILGVSVSLNIVQARIVWAFLSVCLLYAIVAAIQVVPQSLASLDDPIWQRANGVLGTHVAPRISSTAEIPSLAIGHFLLTVTAFLSGFFVGTSQRGVSRVIFAARTAILIYALYGLAALAITPNLLLWAPKVAYRGSLTGTFVNKNTAAAFFGCGAILWSCWTYSALQSIEKSSFRVLLLNSLNERAAISLILRASAALTCFFALLLTNSRGGLISSSVGLLVALGVLEINRFRRRTGYAIVLGIGALIAVALWLTQMGRIASEGVIDDGRWQVYGLVAEAIGRRPWLGTGAGSFEILFPSLRTADLSSWGVWDYAHSTILEIALEMGLPVAGIVALAALASIFVLVRRAPKADQRHRVSLAAITGIAVLTYLHSLIDFSLQIPGYSIPFGILIGCGLADAAADRSSRRRKPSAAAGQDGSTAVEAAGELSAKV
ncbi:O-antigen ligase family protein [Bradyrhizobium roseum]|uniref:O-antigen ligase family protein n=1 Tax=Bradyrhizobium roseum TaxID=3056648 RepID=UPI00261AE54D|nr:O-antigen ligase family protein [Bradyrhizobium roseus]WKA30555.1 O-antigen ligase family protein [Bradyrhizobium roseus]